MDFLQDWLIEPFHRSLDQVLHYMPNVFVSFFILAVGVMVGTALKYLCLMLFRAVKLDRLAIGNVATELIKKGGVHESFSVLVAKTIQGLVIVFFAITAMFSLEIPAAKSIAVRFLIYLPNLFAAALIVLLGYIVSNFFGRAALITSVNAGLKAAGLIAKLVKTLIILLAITMAIEQLGIGKQAFIIAFAILFGGVVMAVSLALGLGGRGLAEKFLQGKFENGEREDEIRHL